MQVRINNRTEIISKLTDSIISMDIIIFAYIFGSFARGEVFSDIDIGIYLKSDVDRSPLEIESAGGGQGFYSPPLGAIMDIPIDTPLLCGGVVHFEMEDKIGALTGYPVDVRAMNNAPASFVFQVIKDGILIKDANPDIRSDFEGLVFKKTHDFIRFRNEYLREISNAPI